MIDAYFRPLYQQCLIRPILKWSKEASPITITGVSCLFGVLVMPALYLGLNITAILLLLISGYLDTLDNSIAKSAGKLTAEVAALDIIGDRVVEWAVILGLYAVDPIHRGWLTLCMLGSCYIYMTAFLIVALYSPHEENRRYSYTPGLIERSEAFLFFIAMIVFPSYFSQLVIIFSVLVLITSGYRLREFFKFRQEFKKSKP